MLKEKQKHHPNIVAKTLAAGMVALTLSLGAVTSTAEDGNVRAEAAKLVAALNAAIPQLPIVGVDRTPIEGLYLIELEGGQTLYGTADGNYFISGDMYQLGDTVINLAEARRAGKRREKMNELSLDDMVVFSPSGQTRTHVTIFTDVDCGYCRKLHQEMADYNALGIEVRYLAYPRAGLESQTADKIVSAWCADNRNEALTALKAGLTIPAKECANPVAEQYELGQEVGVTGTPAIITADGRMLPGYMPAPQLAEALGL